MLFLYLPIILFNICIDVFSDFYTQAFSLLVYVFILLAPMFINYLKACLCDKEDVDKLQKIDDLLDKEWRLSLKALGVLTAGMLIVSLLFKNIVTSYAIISCIALLIAQILLSTQFISTPLLKLVGIIIVTSTLLSGCLAILPSGSSSCDHPACKENGPFPCMGKNNTCPNKTNCCYDYYCDDCE